MVPRGRPPAKARAPPAGRFAPSPDSRPGAGGVFLGLDTWVGGVIMLGRCWQPFAAAVLLASAAPAPAHHSFAAEFDADTHGELEGEITQVWFNNPHVRFELKTKAADGSAEQWELQASSVTSLLQAGWTADTLKPGDRVKVSGQLGRNGAKKLFLRTVARADGTQLLPAPGRKRQDPNQIHATPGKQYGYGPVNNHYPADITGVWRNSYKFHLTVDDLTPKPTPFTPEGRKVFESNDPYEDPSLRCRAPGLPRIFGAPYDMEIVDAGDHYVVIYVEHNNPRRIWMDGRTPPADTPPTSLGFSVGHWDGDTLVIETTHLTPGWLDGSGLPMSGDGTRLVERWTVAPDRLSMERSMTIYDPYYTAPLVRTRASARDDGSVVAEQATCDPDSYYRDLLEMGRLKKHFGID
jgi:hypothetical protein